eukprot:scaffold192485_cov18-Tisochrysis_lutea.AAC.1
MVARTLYRLQHAQGHTYTSTWGLYNRGFQHALQVALARIACNTRKDIHVGRHQRIGAGSPGAAPVGRGGMAPPQQNATGGRLGCGAAAVAERGYARRSKYRPECKNKQPARELYCIVLHSLSVLKLSTRKKEGKTEPARKSECIRRVKDRGSVCTIATSLTPGLPVFCISK